VASDPAASRPAASDPVASDPVASHRAASRPAASDRAASDPAALALRPLCRPAPPRRQAAAVARRPGTADRRRWSWRGLLPGPGAMPAPSAPRLRARDPRLPGRAAAR